MKWWYIPLAVVVASIISNARLSVVGDETSVIISPTSSQAAAFPLADSYCAQYGKVAHFSGMEGFRQVFDCETRGR